MKIELLTTDKGYNLSNDNTTYFLNFGKFKTGEQQTAKLKFSEVNSKTFSLEPTCGCTTAEKRIISETEVEQTVIFNGKAPLPKT